MIHYKKTVGFIGVLLVCSLNAYAFTSGFVLSARANLSGSLTDPKISKKDMDYLGGDGMKGTLGYVAGGEVELTYLFNSVRFLNCQDDGVFSGIGWSFNLGLGQGFSGQISGQYNSALNGGKGKHIEVFCRIHMTPVLNAGTSIRSYFLRNRIALGGSFGIRMLLDPQPIYEMYTNLSEKDITLLKNEGIDFSNETGTLIITEEQMKKMNPIGYTFKGFIEYNQPFIRNMELVVGAFLSYTIYKPKYITMPQKLMDAAKKNGLAKSPSVTVDIANTPIDSFYMNSFDFGLSLGMNFKV